MSDVEYRIGDSAQILKEVSSESVHLVVTSPPYWNAKDYGREQIGFGQTYEEYTESLNQIWKECIRTLVPNGKIAVVIQPLPVSTKETKVGRSSIINIMHDVESCMYDNKLDLSNLIIWDKRKYNNQRIFGSYPYPPNLYSHVSYEFIYVFRKRGLRLPLSREKKKASQISLKEWADWCFNPIWDIPPVIKIDCEGRNVAGHLAPFPLEIPRRLIRLFTFVGDLVLDPFLGSGTTLAACILEKRRGFGIEIQKDYEPLIRMSILHPGRQPRFELAKAMKLSKTLSDFIKTQGLPSYT